MISFKMFLCALALGLLALSVESSSGGGTPNFTHDLSGADLTTLYNSPVYLTERMRRPLDGMPFSAGIISHTGVRVTLADRSDGPQWLVHKGKNYGRSSQTVVVAARHMSSDWEVIETRNYHGRKTVADLVEAGGPEYKFLTSNCHHASGNMMDQ